jgi:hypothetical protein
VAITQADKDRLERAVTLGELTVELDGRRVTYRSMTELLQALAYVGAELDKQAGPAAQNRQSFAAFARGLD